MYWDFHEVKGWVANAEIFCQFFDITENGNWEGKNILRVKSSLEDFAREKMSRLMS